MVLQIKRHNTIGPETKRKLAVLEEIVDTGLTHRELAELMSERLGKPFLPGSVHSFLKRDPELKTRYVSARRAHLHEISQLKQIARAYDRAEQRLEEQLNEDFEKLVQKDIASMADVALRDCNIYLNMYPQGKQSPETIYEIFQGYHAGQYANQIADCVGLRQKSVADVLARMNYKTRDGRSNWSDSLLTSAQKSYVLRFVPKFGYAGTAHRLGFEEKYAVRKFATMNGIKSPFAFKHKA